MLGMLGITIFTMILMGFLLTFMKKVLDRSLYKIVASKNKRNQIIGAIGIVLMTCYIFWLINYLK